MKFGSVCSGIEAASVAWSPLGWEAAWFAEIEPFPSAVLAHHYPHVPNLGDMTTIARRVLSGEVEAPDLLCGGTPCQAFSVAGLRKSLDDDRGNLTLKFVERADAIDHVRVRAGLPPADIFWENVPGVLSTKDNAFGCFLAGLAGEDEPLQSPGGKWANAGCVYGPKRAIAWRTLDAQYFGLAQRRRRVFVVASAGNRFDPATVLFEWDGVRRDTPPSRQAGQEFAGGSAHGSVGSRHNSHWNGGVHPPLSQASQTRAGGIGGSNQEIFEQEGAGLVPAVAATLTASFGRLLGQSGQDADHGHSHLVPDTAHTLLGEGFDASEDGTGRGTPLVPVCIHADAVGRTGEAVTPSPDAEGRVRLRNPGMGMIEDGTAYNLMASGQPHAVVAFDTTQVTSATNRSNPKPGDPCHPLAAGAHPSAIAFHGSQDPDVSGDVTHPVGRNQGQETCVAYTTKLHNTQSNQAGKVYEEYATSLDRSSPPPALLTAMQVRRLTPVECERLQGFPDGYTAIPWRKKPASECPDGPRYKALGNSWATYVVNWLGRRLAKAKGLEVNQ